MEYLGVFCIPVIIFKKLYLTHLLLKLQKLEKPNKSPLLMSIVWRRYVAIGEKYNNIVILRIMIHNNRWVF
jgi:hypothetical protein